MSMILVLEEEADEEEEEEEVDDSFSLLGRGKISFFVISSREGTPLAPHKFVTISAQAEEEDRKYAMHC